MVDSKAETGIKKADTQFQVKETEKSGNYMMRFADGGDPVTIFGQERGQTWVRGKRGESGRFQGEQVTVTPRFSEKPLPDSILNLGNGQAFQIIEPMPSIKNSVSPDSVFVKRIPLDNDVDNSGKPIQGYNSLAEELMSQGKQDMILDFSKANVPLTTDTVQALTKAGI